MTTEATDARPARRAGIVDATTVRGWAGRDDGPTLVDVRTAAEFETAHVPGAHNVPLALLGEHAAAVAARLASTTVLVCQSGTRAEDARRRLVAAGCRPGGACTCSTGGCRRGPEPGVTSSAVVPGGRWSARSGSPPGCSCSPGPC